MQLIRKKIKLEIHFDTALAKIFIVVKIVRTETKTRIIAKDEISPNGDRRFSLS